MSSGPCAGKTTSLLELKRSLLEAGINCFTIPEVYTILMTNGCDVIYPPNYTDSSNRQLSIECLSREMLMQLSLEDSFVSYASVSDKPVVIIGDRGALDIAAYSGEDMFGAILEKLQLSRSALLRRYDIVLHMVTAADGAEGFYSNATNEIRKESVEEARTLDRVTMKSWEGHHNLHVFQNEVGGFDAKLMAVKQCVHSYVTGFMERQKDETAKVDCM